MRRQKPHPSVSDGAMTRGIGTTGASQAGQASVPRARRREAATRRISCGPETRPIGSGVTGSDPSIPRWKVTGSV
jgi:hypothetical protein